MGKTYLLDSNIIIYLIKGTLAPNDSEAIAEAVQMPAHVSVITKMEILGWQPPTKEEELELQKFVEDAFVFTLTDEIVDVTIKIRKSAKIRLPDAIIAATALVNNFTLITRNVSDFAGVDGLSFVNPYE